MSSRELLTIWLLGFALPPRDLEVIVGDLTEEYALRSLSSSSVRATAWYWGQVTRTLPVALWNATRHDGWVSTLGVAVGAYAVQMAISTALLSGLTSVTSAVAAERALIVVSLASLVAMGYGAARIKRGAAVAFAVLIFVAVTGQLLTVGFAAPLWKVLLGFIGAPLATVAGGAIAIRRHPIR